MHTVINLRIILSSLLIGISLRVEAGQKERLPFLAVFKKKGTVLEQEGLPFLAVLPEGRRGGAGVQATDAVLEEHGLQRACHHKPR